MLALWINRIKGKWDTVTHVCSNCKRTWKSSPKDCVCPYCGHIGC